MNMKSEHPKIRVLHLEDQPYDADQIARILRKAQLECELKVVDTRNDYKKALSEFEPAIIISDHSLPSFNSIEALAILRQSGLKIPFILVTGMVSEEFAVEAMKAGVDDYILKDRLQRLPIAVVSALEKYRLEREQRKAETLLRNIDANSLDVIYSVNEEGQFIHVSAACETVWGYTADELIGKPLIDFVYPQDREITTQASVNIMAGINMTHFENRYMRKDGSLVPMVWSARWDAKDRIRYGVARDATEKKNAEKTIATERRLLSDLALSAPVSMCILKGKDHVFELANPIFLQKCGKKDVVGKTAREVFPELEGQGFFELLDEVYQTGEPFSTDEMAMKIDREGNGHLTDSYRNLLQQPYRDEEGNVAGIFYFGVDVTEQVLSRKKIEESEKKYRQIVETAQEGIWVIDEHNKTTFVNNKMCKLLDYTREEMLGKEFYFFMDDEAKQIATDSIRKRREGKGDQYHLKYISKTKRELWANVSANPLFHEDGTYKGSLAMITDITKQKRIEEENKRLGFVASLTVNAVIVTDAECRITWVNNGFERITEYSFEEVLGKTAGEFLQGPETDPEIIRYMRECGKQGQGFRVEAINYSKSGRKYWLDIEVVPLRDHHDRLTGFIAIEQDITDRKNSEQETAQLINSLQKKNKDFQQFSYIVSHNLRAPIAKILGLTSIIDTNSVENKFLIEKITETTTNLDNVIKDINIIVSARKSDKEKMEYVIFDNELKLITQVLETEINDSGAVITSDFSQVSGLFAVKSYSYSIIYNLISNAIKYRLPGVPLQIHLQTTQGGKFICLLVRDNGMGIDLVRNGSKIFGLYKRFHGSTIPGKGMGLNLVKTHAESLGGHVEVESKVNEGTVFKVFILKEHGKETSK